MLNHYQRKAFPAFGADESCQLHQLANVDARFLSEIRDCVLKPIRFSSTAACDVPMAARYGRSIQHLRIETFAHSPPAAIAHDTRPKRRILPK